jgi:hypothetical protein
MTTDSVLATDPKAPAHADSMRRGLSARRDGAEHIMAKKKQHRGRPVWLASELLDDDTIMDMDPHEFMTKFRAALKGEKNEFAPYVRFTPPEPPDTSWEA